MKSRKQLSGYLWFEGEAFECQGDLALVGGIKGRNVGIATCPLRSLGSAFVQAQVQFRFRGKSTCSIGEGVSV